MFDPLYLVDWNNTCEKENMNQIDFDYAISNKGLIINKGVNLKATEKPNGHNL